MMIKVCQEKQVGLHLNRIWILKKITIVFPPFHNVSGITRLEVGEIDYERKRERERQTDRQTDRHTHKDTY